MKNNLKTAKHISEGHKRTKKNKKPTQKELRKEIYNKNGGYCGYCGNKIEYKQMQVDHIIPQANFLYHVLNRYYVPKFLEHLGEDDVNHEDNLMCTCRSCNNYKSAMSLECFRKELGLQIERLNNNSGPCRLAKRYGLIKENQEKVKFHFELNNRQ